MDNAPPAVPRSRLRRLGRWIIDSRRPLVALVGSVIVLGVLIQVLSPGSRLNAPTVIQLGPEGPDVLKIAIVEPQGAEDDMFLEGARLAVAEVNAAGGAAGHRFGLVQAVEEPYSDDDDVQNMVIDSLRLAERVTEEENLLAVIGHRSSTSAVPASSVYDHRGVLYLATHATASSLTHHGFSTVFALQPSNSDIASMMAHYALGRGLRRIVVLGDDSAYGVEMASQFRSWVARGGGRILFHGSLSSKDRSIERLLMFLLDNKLFRTDEIDAIFVSSSSIADTADFIRMARELNMMTPILGPEYIFSNIIERRVGPENMKDVAGVSLYDGDSQTTEALAFASAFKAAYGEPPDQLAAIGYDAVKLLAYIIDRNGVTDATRLADSLRIMRYAAPFEGATGRLVFDANGLVTDTYAFIVRHDGTMFHSVASYKKPLDWTGLRPPGQSATPDSAMN